MDKRDGGGTRHGLLREHATGEGDRSPIAHELEPEPRDVDLAHQLVAQAEADRKTLSSDSLEVMSTG
ncbi:hypothetical protein POL68_32775 [Stigmatella sp. ncwal1]|uniref:Uncharacterized protein n=1 Tax=Stigmatella ashevillensis TaxID=2995309 RepID=A0ABT5DKJ1_9BACT|nr:hypothetical protein [Stigmatella ashevillena]MDC0713283.1 hypothetical protein [Stigmatella ashevillena]